MNRYFLITTTDGKEFKLPIVLDVKHIGMKANHPGFIAEALKVASLGFCIDEKAANPIVIAPSQIKTVQVQFETASAPTEGNLVIQP